MFLKLSVGKNQLSIKLSSLNILHCRGESAEGGDEPFRAWYGKIGEIRSLVQCPILLMTATANKAARADLKRKFALNN